MSKQEISSGPWTINGNSIVTQHPANIGICKMYGNIGQPVAANARAIAAVPKFISVCKFIMSDAVLTVDEARQMAEQALEEAGQI